jgi:dynein heavy chain, axonemal
LGAAAMSGTNVTKDLTSETSEADEAEKLSQSLGTLRCLDWMVERIRLTDAVYPIEIDDDQRFAGVDFLTSAKANKVFVFLQNGVPVMQMTLPDDGNLQEIFYFLKDSLALSKFMAITPENIGQVITYGSVRGKAAIDELHNLMKQFFVPDFRTNTSWPDTLKKDVSSQTSRFMSSLTETVHAMRGATVLYVPEENVSNPLDSSQNKDLVQRLESTVIHWTRQIKGVLGGSDSSSDAEATTLLVEIDAWKSRVNDLSGVQEQLQRAEVGQIISTLQFAKSSYLALFLSLKEQIMKGYEEATESLKFLSIFKEPCTQLNSCTPLQCEQLLLPVFSLIRFVWNSCAFFSSEERVTSLMRKFCNQVIECFSRHITMKEIIFKNVEHAKAKLEECIHCGEIMHVSFEKVSKAISMRKDENSWNFENSRVFAQLDAFIQRCRDLNEVCRWRIQFESLRWSFSPIDLADIAAYEEAKAALTPDSPDEVAVQLVSDMEANIPKMSKVVFGGSQGGDIEKSLDNIRLEFQKSVSVLGQLPYNALDVKAPNWHVDLADFKGKTKDLEVMFLNVLQGAVSNCGSISMKLDRLECFREISLRDTIIQAIDKHTRDLIVAHGNELLSVQKEFDRNRRDPPISFNDPKYAGAAIWARCFKRRVQREMDNLAQYWPIIKIREYSDARILSEALINALGDYITKMNGDWMLIAENVSSGALELRIMLRFDRGLLKMNFDSSLLRLYREVESWECMHFNIPFAAMELTKNRDVIRVLRESVLGVVREYNDILNSMDDVEMKIFAEKVRAVDRKILNGVNKLAWIHKGQVESFCKEGGKLCKHLLELVRDFKKKRATLQGCLSQIAELQLVHIERKRIYEEGQFEQCQVDHRSAMAKKLENLALEIRTTLKAMFYIVSLDPVDVQKEWDKFVASIDHSLEEALKQSIKRSYHTISRAINGDKSHDVQPIFKVNVLLEKSGSDHNSSQKVEFRPSMQSLTEMVNIVCKEIIAIISVVSRNRHRSEVVVREEEVEADPSNDRLVADLARRRDLLEATLRREKGASIQDNISNDEEVLRIMVSIFSGMSSSVDKLQKYLTFWEKYKHIWDLDKEAFVRRYVRNPRPLKSIQDDIQKYRDIQREVQSEEGLVMINFISSDASLLKQAIIKHCVEWQARFTDHINTTARTELSALQSLFESTTASLLRNPKTLDELSDVNLALKDIQANLESVHARFDPLKQQYNLLEYFEVRVKEDELAGLQSLSQQYEQLQGAIVVCEKKVVESKRVMKKELERNVAVFDKDLEMLHGDMKNRAPFSDVGTNVSEATAVIQDFRKQLQSAIENQSNLNKGLAIFDVDPMSRKEIGNMTKDLDMLDTIWKYFADWEALWKSLSVQPIDEVDISVATTNASSMLKTFLKATRDVKDWDAIKGFKTQLEKVKSNFPIVQSLQSKNLRDRHWAQVQKVVGHELGEKKACTFHVVEKVDFSKFSDALLSICSVAAQEVSIETSLNDLDVQWEGVRLDIDKYKDRGHKMIKGLPIISSILDECSVLLSSLKVSPHHVPFKTQIHEWELCLSSMSEALEAVSHVQKLWMYLESIFVSSDDSVVRQLPAEAATFERVDSGIRVVMEQIHQNPLVKAALCDPTILPELISMGKDLESVRKNLEDFLETKRQAFCRFYFVGNDDVLDVLGCNKDLKTMQPHVKKIFPNITSFLLKQNQRKIQEVEGIASGEEEHITFGNAVAADGPVEHWMSQAQNHVLCVQFGFSY